MWQKALCVAVICLSSVGCLPRTFITKDPGPRDRGIRYYRPKPYLMVKPLTLAIAKEGDPKEPIHVAANFVSIEQVILPDFSEEYSIHIRSGLGINETSVTLDQGWNLTALNAKLDSQFDENLTAVADLVKAGTGRQELKAGSPGGEKPGCMTVQAYDVPMGLYEAVISPDRNGRKRLYGFRYVGFFPFSSCPMESCGVESSTCDANVLYGIVYDRDLKAMVFKELNPDAMLIAPNPKNPEDCNSDDHSSKARHSSGSFVDVKPEELPSPEPTTEASEGRGLADRVQSASRKSRAGKSGPGQSQ